MDAESRVGGTMVIADSRTEGGVWEGDIVSRIVEREV